MRLSLWIKVGLRDWQNYVPLVPTLQNYNSKNFNHDLSAGLVVGMVTVPQAVAYAYLAGMPPQAGLYACLLPMLLYAIFGSSKQLVVGPVAVAALMVVATVSQHAPMYSNEYLNITTILCLQVGLLLWLLRLSRMGGLVNLLSHPVITGFVNAAAILIIVSQLPAFTGITTQGAAEPFNILTQLLSSLSSLHIETFLLAACALALLLLFPKLIVWLSKLFGISLSPTHAVTRMGPMVVALLGVLYVSLLEPATTIATVGQVPAGLPSIKPPPFDPQLWISLAPSALIIALVAYVETYSIGATLAARQKTRVNSHQELIALGAANVGAAFTGAYPVAGSFSRSSVNYYTGAKTQVSNLICALVIILVLLFFTAVFTTLPKAVLAAIVMVSVLGLMDLKTGREHWSLHRPDVFTEYTTALSVLFFGVEIGIMAGVVISIAFFIRTSSRPNITQVGRLGDTEEFRSIKRHDVETIANVLALRVDENIYFANATQIEDKFLKRAQRRKGTKHLLMVCSSVNMIDATGFQMLHRLNESLKQTGVTFHLSDIKGTLLPVVEAAKLETALSGEIFFSADRAMKRLSTLTQPQIHSNSDSDSHSLSQTEPSQ